MSKSHPHFHEQFESSHAIRTTQWLPVSSVRPLVNPVAVPVNSRCNEATLAVVELI